MVNECDLRADIIYIALSGRRSVEGDRDPGRCPGLSYFWPFRPDVLKALVEDRRIGRQRDAVQVDDFAVHNQLDIDRSLPAPADLLCVGDRVFAGGGSVDANARLRLAVEPEIRSAFQDNRRALALDLEQVRVVRSLRDRTAGAKADSPDHFSHPRRVPLENAESLLSPVSSCVFLSYLCSSVPTEVGIGGL